MKAILVIMSQNKELAVDFGDIEIGSGNKNSFDSYVYPIYKRGDIFLYLGTYKSLTRAKEVLEAIVKQQAELNAAVATAQAYATYLTRIHDHEEKIKQLSVFYMPEE